MGIIKSQGIKQSVVTYIGVLIGAVNLLFIYPYFLQPEELGLVRFITETAILFLPFISFGIPSLSVRMFPKFESKAQGHNGLLFFLTLGVTIGFIVFLLIIFLLRPYLQTQLATKSQLMQDYWIYIIPVAVCLVYSKVFTQYVFNFKKITLPAVFNDLYLKIGVPLMAILYGLKFINLHQAVYTLIAVYAISTLSSLIYVKYIGEWSWKPNWSFLTKPIRKEMSSFALYGVLGNLGGILATRIDFLMVGLLAANDLKDVGVYAIVAFVANIITVPARAINNIAAPVIAKAWKENDTKEIGSIYKKSSTVLLTLGIFFLIGIWCSVDDLFALIPNGNTYAQGKYVILILGIGRLFDLATGVNNQIIAYSKYFRFNFYAVLILAVLNIISNYIFIPIFQINGAALATMTSLLFFNLAKMLYIRHRMDLQPFTNATWKVTLIGLVTLAVGMLLPSIGIPLIDIIIRSAVISLCFIGSVLYFKVSEDITLVFKQVWQLIFNRGNN